MLVRDHSLTRNQSSSDQTAQTIVESSVNDLNASPTRSSFHHQTGKNGQESAQQHSCCSPSHLLIPPVDEDCGFPEERSPHKKSIRRIHFCPEFLKAMENVQFIADHTKKSEEDVDVSTFSFLLFQLFFLSRDISCCLS
jgi:hypothetical protein